MKATQAILYATSVAICFWGPAQAEDSQLLIFAAKMNASHEMAKICDKGDPGFLEKYEVNLRLLEERVAPLGINEALRKKAESIPELSSTNYVEKIKSAPAEMKEKWCRYIFLEVQEEAKQAQEFSTQ